MPDAENPTANDSLVMSFKLHKQKRRGRTVLWDGEKPGKDPAAPTSSSQGRIPRISRLMALAIHLQNLVDQGVVQDYAEIARLTGLTRARVTQIMNLTLLSPRIQEEILFLPNTRNGRDFLVERNLRDLASNIQWEKQMNLWHGINAR